MPTNEERREIAARLREIETDSCRCEDYLYALEWATGCDFGKDYEGLNHRLIDLIEPESICVANITLTAEQQEELFQRVMEELRVNGCRNCGAKVVDA